MEDIKLKMYKAEPVLTFYKNDDSGKEALTNC